MKSITLFKALSAFVMLMLTACTSEAQNNEASSQQTKSSKVEVIQFHSEHRCMTCNKIETLTKETLKNYPQVPFSMINVDDKKNAEKAEAFEAAGTALFLYSSTTGAKKDLTDFAFMNASNSDKFIAGLKKEIEAFVGS